MKQQSLKILDIKQWRTVIPRISETNKIIPALVLVCCLEKVSRLKCREERYWFTSAISYCGGDRARRPEKPGLLQFAVQNIRNKRPSKNCSLYI